MIPDPPGREVASNEGDFFSCWITEQSLRWGEIGPQIAFVCDVPELDLIAPARGKWSTHPAYWWRVCEHDELSSAHLLVIQRGQLLTRPSAARQVVTEVRDQVVNFAADLATAVLVPSGIALDFEDVAYVLSGSVVPSVGVAMGAGVDRVQRAIMEALKAVKPISGRYLLLMIFGQGRFTLEEIRKAMNALRGELDSSAFVVYAVGTDDRLPPESVRATVVAA